MLRTHFHHTCGHVRTVEVDTFWVGQTREQTREETTPCPACALVPAWQRAGYPDESTFRAAVAHDEAVTQTERDRAEELARIAALPEADRPFTARAPGVGRGGPSLDELAAED